jgi:hypothetical protein
MAEDGEMNNWRQFQGTELGALMGQIYGNQNKPKINYPKLQTKAKPLEHKTFIPGGGKIDAEDPRKATRRTVNLEVPKNFQEKRENVKPIDVINRRRSADSIKAEMDEIKLRQTHYRPAHVKPISGAEEKERLNQIFTYKGGKGLPQELTHPMGEMPLEVESRRKEAERMDAVRIKRGLGPSAGTLAISGSNGARRGSRGVLSENEQMQEMIRSEIEERREHLQEMQELGGLKPEKEKQMKLEIARKVAELEGLMRA